MRNSIMGFNQERLIEIQKDDLKLDMTDLLLMDYIQKALSQPSMEKKVDAYNQPYVWLKHQKILEDLPILNIKESMLKKRIAKLVDLGLIKTMRNTNIIRGSKSYYTITELFEYLQMDNDTTKCKKLPLIDRPSVKNYPSDNKLTDNKQLNNNTINSIIKEKPKKQSLYSKCVDLIDDYTNNAKLKDVLMNYLRMRLEIKDKPFYTNQFKGMLNKLSGLADNVNDQIDIVQQSIDRGYLGFFEVKKYNNYSRDARIGIENLGDYSIPKAKDDDFRRLPNGEIETF